MTVYLLHFERPYFHAQHYIGSTSDLSTRLDAHRKGYSSKLMRAVHAAGIEFTLVRTWPGNGILERQLKRRKDARSLCPICNPTKWLDNGFSKGDPHGRQSRPTN